MPETPHQQFQYPPAEYPLWYRKGLKRADLSEGAQENIPPEFFEQDYEGFVDWLEKLEIRLQGMVQTRADLPAPDDTATTSWTTPEGNNITQRRVFIIVDERAIVYDTGTAWETLAGLGANGSPVPPIHTEQVTTNQVSSDRVFAGDVNTDTLRKDDNHVHAPQLIGHHYQAGAGAVNVSIDTRAYSEGEIIVRARFTTVGTQGPTPINMRISGYSGLQYDQVNISGTGVNNTIDASEWTLGTLVQEFGQFACEYRLSRPRVRPMIHGTGVSGAGNLTANTLSRGAVVGPDVFSIDTVDIFTPDPIEVAEIEVWGSVMGQF